jgi:hypothetical protein
MLKYDNLARDLGVELGGWSFGAQFGDFNNDGNLDLYLENGYISLDRQRSYWYDFAKVAGGNSSIIGDAANWPAFDGRSLSGYQQKRLWLNDGAGKFNDVAQAVESPTPTTAALWRSADFGTRGVLDVVVANQRGPLLIYKNTVTPDNDWIEFDLEGTKSNRSAIGAQVTLFWDGKQQVQQVSGGNGFASQNDRRVHFGLGKIRRSKGRHSLALGRRADPRPSRAQPSLQCEGTCHEPATAQSAPNTRILLKPQFSGSVVRRSTIRYTCRRLHHADSARRQLVVRHSRELLEDAARHRYQHRRDGAGPHLSAQMAAPGQRLHHRHQRRHPAALAGVLALRAVQPALHHLEVCAARSRPSHLEPLQLRHLRHAVSGLRDLSRSLSIQWGNNFGRCS